MTGLLCIRRLSVVTRKWGTVEPGVALSREVNLLAVGSILERSCPKIREVGSPARRL